MYYDSIEEAKQASPQWTHILTPSLEWNGRPDVKGKYCAAQRKADGFFYRVQDKVRLQVCGNSWEVVTHALATSADPQPTADQLVAAARFDQAASEAVATERQIGGDHYKSLKIQPIEYIDANNLPYLEGNVVKYVTRHASKNGVQDIDKAIHYLELIKQMRYAGEQK
ncbi:hypothetical protein SIPHO076v1_p0002 [Vibrio phage PS34B.1]|nr:hypothetical protein SIPHO076v1_p0002 [Vibrio phage PS34B.1]